MKYIVIIGFLFLSTFTFGQTITGKITTENGDEIPYANVYLKKTKIGTSSDENGFYELNKIPTVIKKLPKILLYLRMIL
jgi:outer membrane receptor for ferrienterochelin and colicins